MTPKKTDTNSLTEASVPAVADNYRSGNIVVWFSRIIRWGLGALFIGGGIYYYHQDGWPAIIFGAVLFVTGFFRPRRCLEEGSCAMNRGTQNK